MSLVFGKYEKIRRIAQGGMGEVFLARQTGVLDRLAILKSLRADLANEREFVEQFLDEARVAATLNHPNIVSIYDVGEFHGTYYIAMEYVPGEDLSKLWYAAAKAGVGLPFQVSVRICFEAAHGLDHAHKAKDVRGNPLNIVHRDVSPQNIMVRGDGVVKLVDFGIAKAANKSSRTQAGMVKGKLQYMSPEQVRGEALDGRSDQFSLGVVLWEMCTGRRLFKADSEINTLQKILQSPIPKPSDHVPGFPAELESTILRMLQRDAEKRFKDTGAVATELKSYLDRAAIAGGETTVSTFVQQILGKELDARIADLTPMEATEAAAPMPQRPAPTTRPAVGSGGQPAPPMPPKKPAVQERPDDTAVVAEDDIRRMPTGPANPSGGDWQVKKADGSVVSFREMSTLHQWILDGQVVGDDSFSSDGVNWKKLRDAPQFSKFLEIAAAARSVAAKKVSAPQPSSPGGVPQPPSAATVTRPLPKGLTDGTTENPDTMALKLPDAPNRDAGSLTGAFQLGDLPPSQTGTWGAPEIALAVDAARSAKGAGDTSPVSRAPAGANDGLTPTTPTTQSAQSQPDLLSRAARVPTFVWMLGGIAVALAVVVGSMAAFAPELLLSLVGAQAEDHTEVVKAVTAARGDDPQALDVLLKDAEQLARQEPPVADAAAAASLLHLARARVDDETAKLNVLLAEIGVAPAGNGAGAGAVDAGPVDAAARGDVERHREAGYALAKRAIEKSPNSPGALLAMATYKGEKGEVAELEIDADRAVAAAKGTPVEQLVTSEIELIRSLVEARGALESTDAPSLRQSAQTLAKIEDPRARSLVRLVKARAAALALAAGDEQAKADIEGLRADVRGLSDNPAASADARVQIIGAIAKALEKKSETPGKKPPTTPTTPVKPPVASAVDAGPGGTVAVAPPATPPATAVDAGPPPPPETFETAIEKARRAAKAARHKEAAKWAKKALELKPGVVEAQLILGFAYIELGVAASARQAFKQVLTKEPTNCDAQIGLAIAVEAEQKTEEAKAEYMKYVEICPDGKDLAAAKGAISRLE